MNDDKHTRISLFSAQELAAHLPQLGALLHACVQDGASVNFVLPFTQAEGETFWRDKVLPGVRGGALSLLVARRDGVIAGTVQLDCDTPPNQPHRAEVRKLLVHPAWRRRGIAQALMDELESLASRRGRSLLTLDTRSGDRAEPLYGARGYRTAGVIPGFCRDPLNGRLDSTTLMYKAL
ncbi:MAG TPA: GNAT family N-acetyltransferase [Janthinobacterium sp.]|nr:GNAT family N-acetyltransferase [Janthinobacterium sp.]